MEAREYETMARCERTHWWYRAQRAMVLDELKRLGLPSGASCLDVGCGTGVFADEVSSELGVSVTGVDVEPTWGDASREDRRTANANDLPFEDRSFDLVYSVDVICCEEVDPQRACLEMSRVLKPDGYLLLAVPAYQWMLSVHDEAVHCIRRFDRKSLHALVVETGLVPIRSTHLFPSFFPLIAAFRLARRALHSSPTPTSDVRILPRPINDALYGWCQIERTLLRHMAFPFGTTHVTIARKPEP